MDYEVWGDLFDNQGGTKIDESAEDTHIESYS